METQSINYLKSPELVFRFQQYFGIKKIEDAPHFKVTQKFWYYLFIIGTELGDELFYSTFLPFWFWNIDGYVGRRVVLVWAIVMYIGQGVKDIVRWPRPGPPAIRVQNKWALEYGMPSTHAMVGISIPFSVFIFTLNRYQYNIPLGLSAAIFLCSLICFSRLYLGMHTVLDILAGLGLAALLMFPLVPCVEYLDNYLLTHPSSPILLLATSILLIVYYPNSQKWTPTRGDTTMIISVTVGIHIGAWLNYQSGIMSPATLSPPYAIYWPSYFMMGCVVLRLVMGLSFILFLLTATKKISFHLLCALLKLDPIAIKNSENSLENRHKTFIELSSKYISCGMTGLNILYFVPLLFRALNIERPTFYTEI